MNEIGEIKEIDENSLSSEIFLKLPTSENKIYTIVEIEGRSYAIKASEVLEIIKVTTIKTRELKS